MLARRALLGAAACCALGARAGRAQRFADLLRVSWSDPVTTLDPYATPLRTGLALMPEVWDGLVYRDPDSLEMLPLLALRWRRPDPLTIEFDLRPDVWFHNGAPFGPADVVATLQRARGGEEVAIPSNYGWLDGAEQSGALQVRVRLAHRFPAALDFLAAAMPILPHGLPPNAGIGTGPWRIDDFRLDRIRLARHETYWPGSPKGTTRIARLEIAQPTDAARPFNDLVSGRCDWIWQLTPHQYESLTRAAELQAMRADSMRVQYLALDAAGRSEANGPLTLLPVRQAIAHAIDREKLSALAAPGGGRILDTPCYPTQFGCDAVRARHYGYSPDQARALLSAAGLPAGFATRLVTYAREELAQSLADDLAAVGITAEIQARGAQEAMAMAADGAAPVFLGSWGSSSINDMAAFLPPFFDAGPLDDARLPGLADLLARATATPEADRRRALYGDAIALITGQAVWLPLFVNAATYGVSRTVSFHPTPDELPRFYRVAWQ